MPAQKVLQTKYKEGQIERNRGAAERNQAGSVIRSELTALPRRLAAAFSGGTGALITSHVWRQRRIRCRNQMLRCAEAVQANGQHGRRQIARVSPCVYDAPSIDPRGTEESRRDAGDDSTERGHRHIDDIIADLEQALASAAV
jgi:hypothetical protein